jgi:hypothetical protein
MMGTTPVTKPTAERKPKDEPWITLPTMRLIVAVAISCMAAAGLWVTGAFAFGYGGEIAVTGALGAGLTLAFSAIAVVATMPWISRPASTGMMIWLAGDVLAMGATLGFAFLLYSATSIHNVSLFLGVALAFLIVLPAKAAAIASHMKQYDPR